MIRRNADDDWLLISQIEHARIAAELAQAWRDPELTDFPRREELLSAIRHHDDGWAAWESAPTVNEAGEPRDFTEMPMQVATTIWTRSIDACTSRSAFGGLWVSRHFCYLAERASDSRQSSVDISAIDAFLANQAAMQNEWRERLGASSEVVPSIEERGYHWLQVFDRISLWLCCDDRQDEWRLMLPSGNEVTFQPIRDRHVAVEAFPFSDPVVLSVPAIRLPKQRLPDDESIAVGPLPRATIEWRLTPFGVR